MRASKCDFSVSVIFIKMNSGINHRDTNPGGDTVNFLAGEDKGRDSELIWNMFNLR